MGQVLFLPTQWRRCRTCSRPLEDPELSLCERCLVASIREVAKAMLARHLETSQ